jgi:uncharacterized protein
MFISVAAHCIAQTDKKIVLGTIDSIYSNILNEPRKIWVYVPANSGTDLFSKQRYPVMYLLDGDAHFYSVVGMIHQLSSVNGNTICPEMIVVGIPNTDRTRDLTPTHVDIDPPYMDSAFSKPSGGGEKFMAFIEKELMPHIDSLYPTEPYRILTGHSFGGLTVINTLVHHTNLFNAYVSIDPSMWWNKMKYLKDTKTALGNKKFKGTALYMGIANTMEPGMDITRVKKDTIADSKHIRSILELSKFLNSNKQNGLTYRDKYYDNDDHGSVPLIAEYDALHFIFDYYPLKLMFKDYQDTTSSVAKKIKRHYELISRRLGYPVKPSESMINGMAYQALGNKQFEKAAYFFKMNVTNYPESFNVYDSLGDYHEAAGDKASAAEDYKKALEIKDNPDTRKKLEKLQAK